MEPEPTDEQAALIEATRRFLAAECPIAVTRTLERDPDGFDRDVWRRACDMGWIGLLVDEVHGGGAVSPLGLVDAALVSEEVGRLVAPGPLVPVSVVADALSRRAPAGVRDAVLPGLLDGTEVATWTGPEPLAGTSDGGGLVVDGTVAPVEAGAAARHLLVTAAADGGPHLAMVDADAPGVRITPLEGLDLVRRFASVTLTGARAVPVGGPADVERALGVACVLQCAEVVGALQQVLATTVDYLGDRFSFGRPLASYQALKHRVADDRVDVEACAATAAAAARAVATGAPDAAEMVSVAKHWIGARATEIVQDCVQLHGGIGVTWEHDLHLYLRRVTVARATYGTPEHHAERIATTVLGVA